MNIGFSMNMLVGLLGSGTLLSSCALVELSGTMTRKTGEAMTEYSQNNDGVVGKMVGFGGKVNTAVGSSVEGIAQKGKDEKSDKSRPEQFVDAQRSVVGAAFDGAKAKPRSSSSQSIQQANIQQGNSGKSEPALVAETQKSLTQLGYAPGKANGVMRKQTIDALKKFQKDNRLPVTGSLDGETIDKLRKPKSSG